MFVVRIRESKTELRNGHKILLRLDFVAVERISRISVTGVPAKITYFYGMLIFPLANGQNKNKEISISRYQSRLKHWIGNPGQKSLYPIHLLTIELMDAHTGAFDR